MSRRQFFLSCVIMMMSLNACGEGSTKICDTHTCCGGNSTTDSNSAPKISDFKFLYQVPEDPTLAVYQIDFTDADGDLDQGQLDVYVGSATSPSFSSKMTTIYSLNDLRAGSQTGSFALPQNYKLSASDDGKYAIISIQLTDGQGQRSNCEALALEFKVSQP